MQRRRRCGGSEGQREEARGRGNPEEEVRGGGGTATATATATDVSRAGRERRPSTGGGRRSPSPMTSSKYGLGGGHRQNFHEDGSRSGGGGGGGNHLTKQQKQQQQQLGGGGGMGNLGDPEAEAPPQAIVGEDDKGFKFFCLVQRVSRPASKGMVVLRWLREGSDGLYRPADTYWEERPDALISVRTLCVPGDPPPPPPPEGQQQRGGGGGWASTPSSSSLEEGGETRRRPGGGGGGGEAGWKLLTLKSKILDTELMD